MCKKHESDLENYSIIYLQTNEEFLIDMKMSNGPKIICEKKKEKWNIFLSSFFMKNSSLETWKVSLWFINVF